MTMRKLTHLDLFSGIGGFSLAASWAGFETVAFCETNPFASSILKKHWPDVPNYGDVKKFCRRVYDCEPETEEEYVECPRCKTEFGECACVGTDEFTGTHESIDLLTGGVPCQPASLIGQRRGPEDERWLWPDTVRIMREVGPRFGVFENPAAILTLDGGRAFNGIVSGLAAIGFDCWWDVLSVGQLGGGIEGKESSWLLPTPTARDWKDTPGMKREAWNRSREDQLPRRIFAIENAKTGDGMLNPEFSLWLMGFPAGWLKTD